MNIRDGFAALITVFTFSLGSITGDAAVIITGSTLDATPPQDSSFPADGIGDSVQDLNKVSLIVGAFNTPGQPSRRSAVFVFNLPTLPVGAQLGDATFSARLFAKQNTVNINYNVDLYALRISDPTDGNPADDAVLASDYGAGVSPSGTLLQDNWVTLASSTTRIQTDATADGTLLTFLQNNWVDGGRLFLRANADTIDFNTSGVGTLFAGFEFGSSEHPSANDHPELELHFIVPEPSISGLIMLGALIISLRKRFHGRPFAQHGA